MYTIRRSQALSEPNSSYGEPSVQLHIMHVLTGIAHAGGDSIDREKDFAEQIHIILALLTQTAQFQKQLHLQIA